MEWSTSLFDKLFANIHLSEAASPETYRALVELSVVESRFTGQRIHSISLVRARKCLGLGESQEFPKAIEKGISVANCNWGNNPKKSEMIGFNYLRDGETKGMYLPLVAFSREAKAAIFQYFAQPILEVIREWRQWTFAQGVVPLNDMLNRLAQLCDSRDLISGEDKATILEALFRVTKDKIEAIKQEILRASSEPEAARMENKLRVMQTEAGQIAAELQSLNRETPAAKPPPPPPLPYAGIGRKGRKRRGGPGPGSIVMNPERAAFLRYMNAQRDSMSD